MPRNCLHQLRGFLSQSVLSVPTVPTSLDSGETKWLFGKATCRENSCSDPPPSTGDSQLHINTALDEGERLHLLVYNIYVVSAAPPFYIKVRGKGGNIPI